MKGWGLSLVARWVLTAVTVALPIDTGAVGWKRVQIPDPVARRVVQQALDQGWTWLGTSRCRSIFSQFSDRNGRSLATRLDHTDEDLAPGMSIKVVHIAELRSAVRAIE
jgi:hypothetical protein